MLECSTAEYTPTWKDTDVTGCMQYTLIYESMHAEVSAKRGQLAKACAQRSALACRRAALTARAALAAATMTSMHGPSTRKRLHPDSARAWPPLDVAGPSSSPLISALAECNRRCCGAVPAPPSLCASPRQTVYERLPPLRAIADFPHHAPLAYTDILEASGSREWLVDFSRVSLLELMDEHQSRTVAALPKAPGGGQHGAADVCWFVQLGIEVAAGMQLSLSTTLSSPECVGSAALHHLLSKLESAFLSAAASRGAASLPCHRPRYARRDAPMEARNSHRHAVATSGMIPAFPGSAGKVPLVAD